MHKPIIGRPKDLQKRQAILEAAAELFLELGYEGSSMDKIAKLAGVSKLTVYSHFQDKAQLFTAAIAHACETRLPKYLFEIEENSDTQQILEQLAYHFLLALYSPEAIKLNLLMSSLVQSNLELVHMFHQAAQGPTHKNITDLFSKIQQFKKIQLTDPTLASQLFISLLTDVNYDHVLLSLKPVPTTAEIQTHVKQRIVQFLTIYPLQSA